MRSPLCLHATLAAAGALFAEQELDTPIVVTTAMHGQSLALSRDGEEFFVGLKRQAVAAVAPDPALVAQLRPHLERIVAWGKAAGINGIYAYCRIGEDVYEGRNFNHLEPALEDSATGVAAGALTVLLGQPISLYQDSRRCVIRTLIDGDNILIGGRASQV